MHQPHEHRPTFTAHPRATLTATILGSSLAFIDGSVVNVALPALARDLHALPADLPWTINAYLLPLGALILLGGGLGDHYGRRRMFLIGLAAFTLASVICLAAPSLAWLLAGRALQGLGAALLMPNSLAILGGAFAGEAQGRAIGTWAAVGALAAALGPIIGGWLIDALGWRVIFLINLPIAAAAGYLAIRYVDEQKEGRGSVALDAAGAALATASLALLTWALTEAAGSPAGTPSGSPSGTPSGTPSGAGVGASLLWIAAVLGAVLMGAFLRRERRLGERALMPFALFTGPTFAGLTLLTFFLYGSLGGLLVLLPYLLIQIEQWTAVAAGAALLPIPVLIGLGSRYMGRVAARYGSRLPLAMGSFTVGIGLALYARIGAGAIDYWRDLFPATLLIALGMGACVAPLTASVMAAVDTDHVGVASGFNSAVARVAGLVATALLGLVFSKQGSAADFLTAFRVASLIGAASSLLAGICALLLIRPARRPEV